MGLKKIVMSNGNVLFVSATDMDSIRAAANNAASPRMLSVTVAYEPGAAPSVTMWLNVNHVAESTDA